MKSTHPVILTLVWILVFPQFTACAFRKEAPDPVKVQEEIATYRNQEVELVRATIPDPERAERFVGLLGQRDELISESIARISTYREQMTQLNSDYHADRERFETLMARYSRQRAEMQRRYVDLIVAMKAETAPEEWKAIASFQMKRLHFRQLTYGQAAEDH